MSSGPLKPLISWDDFEKIDLRAGTVVDAKEFPEARKPAYRIWVDFGPELGVRQTSAQVTAHYRPEDLVGMTVLGVVNFPPKRIAGFESQFLLTGFEAAEGGIILAQAQRPVPDGAKLH